MYFPLGWNGASQQKSRMEQMEMTRHFCEKCLVITAEMPIANIFKCPSSSNPNGQIKCSPICVLITELRDDLSTHQTTRKNQVGMGF